MPAFKKFAHQIAKITGEDSLGDGGLDASTKADLKQEAKAKTAEASELLKKGDYSGAERLQEEARLLIARTV